MKDLTKEWVRKAEDDLVAVRYPGFSANARQVRGALRITEMTRAEIRRRLGLRQLPRVT